MKKQFFLLTLIFSAIFLSGCFEKPPEPVLPTWDVDLTLPILDKSFSLAEMIEKDTTHLKVETNNQIYYSTNAQIQSTTVGDNLKIPDITTSDSTTLGNFEIKSPGTINASISATQIFPSLSSNLPPGNYVIPSNSPGQTVSTAFTAFENFRSVTFESGQLSVTIKNDLPVPIQFPDGVSVYPQDDPSNPVGTLFQNAVVNANSSLTSTIDLSGKTLPSNLGLKATILSPGSGGNPVYLDINQMKLNVSASIENLTIASAEAKIPTQPEPIVIEDVFNLQPNDPEPDLLNEVTFKSGKLNIKITNNIDLGLNGTLVLYNFKRRIDNQPLTINLNIGRKNSPANTLNLNFDLGDYKLVGNMSNSVSYRLEVRTEDTGDDFRTINKNDGVNAEISLSNLVLESISGRVKPREINFDEKKIDLAGLKDYREKFRGAIKFDDLRLEIKLFKTAQFTFDLNLKIVGVNEKTGQKDSIEIPVDQRRFSGNSHSIVLDKNNSNIVTFINAFGSTELPEYFLIKGSVLLNPNYETGQVSSQDSIYGSATISFPASIGISNAEFKDSSDVDSLSDDVKKQMDRTNYGKMFVEIDNGLGAQLAFRVSLFGEVGDSLIAIPKSGDFVVSSANVDANGFVVSSVKSINVIELDRIDIQKLKGMRKVKFFIALSTSNNGGVVKFRTTDSVKVKIYGKLSYKVDISNK